jgi:hypothetical protein
MTGRCVSNLMNTVAINNKFDSESDTEQKVPHELRPDGAELNVPRQCWSWSAAEGQTEVQVELDTKFSAKMYAIQHRASWRLIPRRLQV